MEELKRYQSLGMLYHLAFYVLGLFSDLPICEQRIVLFRVPEIVHALFTSKKEKIKNKHA